MNLYNVFQIKGYNKVIFWENYGEPNFIKFYLKRVFENSVWNLTQYSGQEYFLFTLHKDMLNHWEEVNKIHSELSLFKPQLINKINFKGQPYNVYTLFEDSSLQWLKGSL